MTNTITFEATQPHNKETYIETLELSPDDKERVARYLQTIINDNPMARYICKLTTGEELDINPLRKSKYIDIIKTCNATQTSYRLSEHQAQKLVDSLT